MTNVGLAALIVCVSLGDLGAAAQIGQELPRGWERLPNAGYRFEDAASLMSALNDPDEMVAVIAAAALVKHPKFPGSEAALQRAANDPRENLVTAAARTLQQTGARGWEATVAVRLENFKDPVAQVELAEVLASAGRGDGWPYVLRALRGEVVPSLRYPGIRAAVAFDGLRDAQGQVIDVAAELERITDHGPQTVEAISRARSKLEVMRKSKPGSR